MKRIVLCLMLLITLPSIASVKEVIMDSNNTIVPEPRSMVLKPIVFINEETNILLIQFNHGSNYFIFSIIDANNQIVYQSILLANGIEYVYNLPLLEKGTYHIIIENNISIYKGHWVK